MSYDTLAAEIAEQVKQFHRNPANAKQLNQSMERFQQSPQSLQIVAGILLQGSEPEVVLHFAAHTLVLKVQSGTLGQLVELEESIFQLLLKYGSFGQTNAVLRQLCVAYVDYVLMSYSLFGADLLDRIATLPPIALLHVMTILPEEARNTRIFVHGSARLKLTTSLVTDHTAKVLRAIDSVGISMESLDSLKTWLKAQRFSQTVRTKRTLLGEKYSCSEAISFLGEMPIFKNLLQALNSPSLGLQAAEACGSVVSECLLLTTDSDKDIEFVLRIGESIAALGSGLKGSIPVATEHFVTEKSKQDWELIQRTKLFSRLLSEFASSHLFPLMVLLEKKEGMAGRVSTLLQSMMESGLYFVGVRHSEISHVALDFWYYLLAAYLGASDIEDEEDDVFNDYGSSSGGGGGIFMHGTSSKWGRFLKKQSFYDNQQTTAPILISYFQRLIPILLVALCYPSNPEGDDCFDSDLFIQFRETCVTVINESCELISAAWVIEKIGETLQVCCVKNEDGTFSAPWEKLEACMHILTAVSPKATAGEDRVIPMVLEILPKLIYPTQGIPALLLRASVGRIVSYTPGYFKSHMDLSLTTIGFFCKVLIPGISDIQWQRQTGEKDWVEFAHNQCCYAIKLVLNKCKTSLVFKLDSQILAQVFNAIIEEVVINEKVGIEGRSHVVQGLGDVLSALLDWNDIRAGLGDICQRMAGPALRLVEAEAASSSSFPTNPNAAGPVGVKIYLVSLCALPNLLGHVSFESVKKIINKFRRRKSHNSMDEEDGGISLGEEDEDDDLEGGGAGDWLDSIYSGELRTLIELEESPSSSSLSTSASLPPPVHPSLAVLEDQWPLVERICFSFACKYEDVTRQVCFTFHSIFSNAKLHAAESPVFLPVLRTAAACFIRRPTSHWMHLVRSFLKMFGELTRVHNPLVQILCELSETFVKHSTQILQRNTALLGVTFDESKMVEETFEVLSEVLRFVDLISHAAKNYNWLSPIVHVAVSCLNDVVLNQQTLPATMGMLHFCELLVTWLDPPQIEHPAADTERVARETSATIKGLLMEQTNSNNGGVTMSLLDKLTNALASMWSTKAAEYMQVVAFVASALRISLASSSRQVVLQRMRIVAETDWIRYVPQDKLANIFTQLESIQIKNSNAGVSGGASSSGAAAAHRMFGKFVHETAKEFSQLRKKWIFEGGNVMGSVGGGIMNSSNSSGGGGGAGSPSVLGRISF